MIRIRPVSSSPTAPSMPGLCMAPARLHDPARPRRPRRGRPHHPSAPAPRRSRSIKALRAPKPRPPTRPPCRAATKFLVNCCIDQAKQQRPETIRRARELEAESRGITPRKANARGQTGHRRTPSPRTHLPPRPPPPGSPGRAGTRRSRHPPKPNASRAQRVEANREAKGQAARQRAAQTPSARLRAAMPKTPPPPRPPGRGRPRALLKSACASTNRAGGEEVRPPQARNRGPSARDAGGATQVVLAPRSATRVAPQETDTDPQTLPGATQSRSLGPPRNRHASRRTPPERLASRPQETDADPLKPGRATQSRYGPERRRVRRTARSRLASLYRRSARHAQASILQAIVAPEQLLTDTEAPAPRTGPVRLRASV